MSVLLLILACSYGFTGSLPGYLHTVKVYPFRSLVTRYGLENELTSRVTGRMVADGRLAVVVDGPDSELAGTVAAYSRSPYSYTSSEVVEEYKLEIRVEVVFTDLVTGTALLNHENVTTWIVYDPVTETEAEAMDRLLDESAEEIIRRCLSGW